MAYEKDHAVAPSFLFLPLRKAPRFDNAQMSAFAMGSQWKLYRKGRTLTGFLEAAGSKLSLAILGFLRPNALVIPLLLGIWYCRRSWWARALCAVLAVFLMSITVETTMYLHYLAPVFALVWLLVWQGMRGLARVSVRAQPAGSAAVTLTLVVLSIVLVKWYGDVDKLHRMPIWYVRSAVAAFLSKQPGEQLVLVRYARNHDANQEYVQNGADIDSEQTIWARELGDSRDAALLRRYAGRHVWLLEPDMRPAVLVPYPPGRAPRPDVTGLPGARLFTYPAPAGGEPRSRPARADL